MGYLRNISEADKKTSLISKTSQTFSSFYDYWLEWLFERTIRLFKWSGLEEIGIPSYEMEVCLMRSGFSALTNKYKKKFGVYSGTYAGKPTVYFDRWEEFSVYSPLYSGILKIGKECVLFRNTAIGTSVLALCHRYAVLLAHTEVTYINVMIGDRDDGGVPVASTNEQKLAIQDYRDSLCNGRVVPILDPAFSGVSFIGKEGKGNTSPLELLECQEKILNSFYNDLGVRTVWNKRGNLIQSEVTGSDPKLLFNLSEMLDQRKAGCDAANKLYGLSLSVELSEELKYNEQEVRKDGESNSTGNVEDV